MSKAKVFVDGKIAGKKVVVFSKSYCPYCKKAKATLKKYFGEDEKDIIEIDNNPDCDAIQQYLGKITGAKSVSYYLKYKLVHACNGKFLYFKSSM